MLAPPADAGWYTPNQIPFQILTENGTVFAITIYQIDEHGIIQQEIQSTVY